jgi:hypothetical protein
MGSVETQIKVARKSREPRPRAMARASIVRSLALIPAKKTEDAKSTTASRIRILGPLRRRGRSRLEAAGLGGGF